MPKKKTSEVVEEVKTLPEVDIEVKEVSKPSLVGKVYGGKQIIASEPIIDELTGEVVRWNFTDCDNVNFSFSVKEIQENDYIQL